MDKYISAQDVREGLKRVIFGADQKIDRWVDEMPAADVRPVGGEADEPCTKEKISTVSEETAYRRSAIIHVIGERLRQITLFGEQSWLPLQAWPAILGEEFGELCEAILETCAENGRHPERGGPQNIYREACQVAAVAVQLMEILEPEISRVPVHPAGEQCLTLREETEDDRCGQRPLRKVDPSSVGCADTFPPRGRQMETLGK